MKKITCLLLALFLLAGAFCAPLSLSVARGYLKLTLFADTGSFGLYYLADKKNQKYEPLFADYDHAALSGFALQIDKKIYDLTPGAEVAVSIEEMPDGARLVYRVKNRAEVTVLFTFLASETGRPEDALKIEAAITNTEKSARLFALRATFDTFLGERQEKHFSTLLKPLINSETVFTSMEADKWVASGNDSLSLLFLFDGANVTVPQQVTLAGRDTLLGNAWLPRAVNGRSFNMPYLLNNSALQIHWRQVRLNPGNTGTVRFYLTAAGSGMEPAYTLKDAQLAAPAAKTGVYVDSSGTAVSVSAITENQLDPDYVAALVRRINELEKNPAGIDPDEIKRLNAELDAIMERLRR